MGYYGVFLGLQYQNNSAMRQSFDANQYDESQSIRIKVPLTIPYMSDNDDFQRVDGIFEHQGEFYRLVKQKYAQDTLTVICVRDNTNKKIHQALSNYVKSFSDNPADQQQNSKLTISFIKDYFPQTFSLKTDTDGWQRDVIKNTRPGDMASTFVTSVTHPPERG
jgi:hypothetical protein